MATRRRSPARPERGRGAILAAARSLVLEGGASTLSLRAVAARAGYSPASLYEYFESREALLAVLAAEVIGRLAARFGRVPESLAPRARLLRLGSAYLGFARENPEDYLLLFGRMASQRRAPSEPLGSGNPFGVVVACVQSGIDGGAFCPRPGFGAEEMAYGFWALAHGMARLEAEHLAGYAADFESIDRLVLEAYVTGLERGAG
ncbi:MAG: TetR/AcrR family transcriptional regulator [Polyangiaceae bacterium]|nr:TetR/AcrR family transcriptional regulator [Polyangiaceae bacterium]